MIDIKHLAELHASAAACNTFTDEYQRTVFDALPGLLAEVEELRKDKERLEATCGHLCKLASDRYDRILELEREIVNEQYSHSWTQAREEMAILAARKGKTK